VQCNINFSFRVTDLARHCSLLLFDCFTLRRTVVFILVSHFYDMLVASALCLLINIYLINIYAVIPLRIVDIVYMNDFFCMG